MNGSANGCGERRGGLGLASGLLPHSLSSSRVRGLDSLRFVLASWVVLGHFAGGLDSGPWIARGIYNNLFNGQAAVIVFFVISGFCIHYPYRHGERFNPAPYYSRRYVRILVPMAAAIAIGQVAGTPLPLFQDSILWSLLCEEIYYALYPLLISLKRRIGWKVLLGATFACSLVVIFSEPSAKDYQSYGSGLNWLLGLPCWLMGCLLAERQVKAEISPLGISHWRGGALLLASLASVLRFHTPVGYPWTLNLFAIYALFWLEQEITFFRDETPPRVTEWAGKWSYSLYLVHVPSAAVFALLCKDRLDTDLRWTALMGFVYCTCYVFYLVIEKPSHDLARRLSQWIERQA